jgi:serpin B
LNRKSRRAPGRLLVLAALAVASALAGGAYAAETSPVGQVATAQAALAWKLIEKTPDGMDALVSPASLASAFAVLDFGADKPMTAALLKASGFAGMNAAEASQALSTSRSTLAAADPAVFVSVDRLVFPPHEAPEEQFLAELTAKGVNHEVADLSKPEAVEAVDKWVSDTTKGEIPELLGQPLDRPEFVVLNALYFKAKWKEPFKEAATVDAPFTDADGHAQAAKLMRLAATDRAFRTDTSFVGIDLPFAGDRYSLVVVTTTDKPRPLKDFAPVKSWLSGDGFAFRKGDLVLPRFSLEAKTDLLPVLQADLAPGLKSPTAFAAFSPNAVMSAILQRARIEVDEQGATAAAATAVIFTRAIPMGDDEIHMIVDKPYLFALRDQLSGLIIVAGYVAKAPKVDAK